MEQINDDISLQAGKANETSRAEETFVVTLEDSLLHGLSPNKVTDILWALALHGSNIETSSKEEIAPSEMLRHSEKLRLTGSWGGSAETSMQPTMLCYIVRRHPRSYQKESEAEKCSGLMVRVHHAVIISRIRRQFGTCCSLLRPLRPVLDS